MLLEPNCLPRQVHIDAAAVVEQHGIRVSERFPESAINFRSRDEIVRPLGQAVSSARALDRRADRMQSREPHFERIDPVKAVDPYQLLEQSSVATRLDSTLTRPKNLMGSRRKRLRVLASC